MPGLLPAVAALAVEQGLQGTRASLAAACGLSNCDQEGSGQVALGRDDMALQKYQTTLSCQLARSSLPTRASLLAVPISDSSWSSRGCSLDLGGEHPPAFPTVMGVEATVLSAVDFIHYHDTIFACSVFFYRSWVMDVDNVLVRSPGIELVGLFKNVRILYLLVTSALRL